ncbi:MAG: flagellar basal body-associated FliL family protein [Spirochaetia bacterium]
MSDEEQLFDSDVGGDDIEVSGKKIGFLSGLTLKILKWVAIILVSIIFIVTVVIITVQFLNTGSQSQTYTGVSPEYEGRPPLLEWFSSLGEIRARTSDEVPHSVMVEVSLGYNQDNRQLQTELIQRTPRLRDMIRSYFSSKTVEQLGPQHESELKLELKERINDILRNGRIREVIFPSFNVINF